LAFTST
jgi:hypothetical protein